MPRLSWSLFALVAVSRAQHQITTLCADKRHSRIESSRGDVALSRVEPISGRRRDIVHILASSSPAAAADAAAVAFAPSSLLVPLIFVDQPCTVAVR